MTIIMPCDCRHKDQDERYGAGNRVFNKIDQLSKENNKYRCTICGEERGYNKGEKKEEGKKDKQAAKKGKKEKKK